MESGYRLHSYKRRMPELLCTAHGEKVGREDVLVDEVYYDVCDGLTYEEAYAKAKQIVAEYPWEKIIAVHIQI